MSNKTILKDLEIRIANLERDRARLILLASIHRQMLQRLYKEVGFVVTAASNGRIDRNADAFDVTTVAASIFPVPSLDAMLEHVFTASQYKG